MEYLDRSNLNNVILRGFEKFEEESREYSLPIGQITLVMLSHLVFHHCSYNLFFINRRNYAFYQKAIAKGVKLIDLPEHLDLTKEEKLRPFITEAFPFAHIIAKELYEMRSRDTSDKRFGKAFPIYPEVFGYAALKARGEIVVELGGASGENTMLLAFSGASKVVLNDINPDELERFNKLTKSFPRKIQEKLESCPGDCLDLLAKRKDLNGRVGLVLSRNLIHFFNDSQQKSFFTSLRSTMKVGGCAILTVNHYGFDLPVDEVNEKGLTAFRRVRALVYDYTRSEMPIMTLSDRVLAQSGASFPLIMGSGYLYKRENSLQKGKYTPEVLDEFKLPNGMKRQIEQDVKAKWKEISFLTDGSVRIMITHTRSYTKENLAKLVQHYGFKIEGIFFVNPNGHLCPEKKTSTQLGICVTR